MSEEKTAFRPVIQEHLQNSLMPNSSIAESNSDGGAEEIRTPDLFLAKEALSRLSYSPVRNIIAVN
jgi:hypothetical protein